MKRILLLLNISIGLLLTGCSKSEDSKKQPDEALRLRISPQIGAYLTRTSTNSQGEYTFSPNDALGLFAVNNRNTPYVSDDVYNRKYTYNGSSWSTENPVYWPEGEIGSVCHLYGYYPYSSTFPAFDKHPFTVSSDQSTVEKMLANDFLYGNTTVNKQDESVTLAMKHQFSLLTIHVEYDKPVSDVLTDVTVRAKTSAFIDLTNGKVTTTGNETNIQPYPQGNISEKDEKYVESFSVILPPQTFTGSPLLDLTIGKEKKSVEVTQTFEKGRHYTMTLDISDPKNITFERFYVAQWDEKITFAEGVVTKKQLLQTGDVVEYQKMRTDHPVTLVVLGDGFTQEHLLRNGLFEQSATEAIEFLFDVEPFKSYREYFNVYFIAAKSNEAGADNTTTGQMKDTYFDTKWNDNYSDMSAEATTVFDFVEKYCPDIRDKKVDVDHVTVFLLVNDPRYGGICWTWNTGRSYMICPLTEGELMWRGKHSEEYGASRGDWRNTFLHEGGGHCFGKLTDEYWNDDNATYPYKDISEHYWDIPFGKNVTADISSNSPTRFWDHLSSSGLFPKVGYWEGGQGYGKGIWRSENISCMIDNRRYFNAYSRQLIVERIKSLAGEPFDYNDFLAKDVNYDEIVDGHDTRSGIYGKNLDLSGIKTYPPLPFPRLVEE